MIFIVASKSPQYDCSDAYSGSFFFFRSRREVFLVLFLIYCITLIEILVITAILSDNIHIIFFASGMNFHCYVHVTMFFFLFFFFTFEKHNDPHTYQDTREEALSKNKKKGSNNNNNCIQVNTLVVRNPEHLGETAPTRNQRQHWTVLINPYIIVPLSFSLSPFLFPFFHLLSLCTASDHVRYS